jgi:pyruvate/2-oxoglutarate dehydrogenase complex dihydrolipoamide acyltransferase (E2) component
MFGIVEFNSINQPNSAILSVEIVENQWLKTPNVVGNTMMLSLACDHRTIDGASSVLTNIETIHRKPDVAAITILYKKPNPS